MCIMTKYKSTTIPQIGIYFYPWYCKNKWSEYSTRHTPQIGKYFSPDPDVIWWQVNLLSELGVDFVILEIVSLDDWSAPVIYESILKVINVLNKKNIQHTFLIDFLDINHNIKHFDKIYNWMIKTGVLKNNIKSKNKKPILSFFYPNIKEIEYLLNEYKEFEIICPIWFPQWNLTIGEIEKKFAELRAEHLFEHFFSPFLDREQNVQQVLASYNMLQFWQPTEQTANMNGFASVCPGYDDLLMRRDPQLAERVPRKNGQTLVEQFQAAVKTNPEYILIYSWNEYFEATNIEPTLEYGTFYFELCKKLIAQIKRGEYPQFPAELAAPEAVPPFYLTPEIGQAAQHYEDRIPRWDEDYYRADILKTSSPVIEQQSICFDSVCVVNVGTKMWPIRSEKAPIFLGARLYDTEGHIISEGRGSLGANDITPGMTIDASVAIEIPFGCIATKVTVGIVWENKFWFAHVTEITLSHPTPLE